ncbi:DNA-directed RNA polymerase I subunit RPA34.5-domain-containing protein [Xylaria arbuscula]|nr:DNA-directed RNA polymerase I subunit RPA34.5-domain-containing protein [Xylaria arbuscula]
MRGAKANIGSLSSMASKVRQEKKNTASAKAKAPLARARDSKPFKTANKARDSSSDSDSDSSANSASDSDSDSDLDAARAKFLAGKAAKQNKAADTKVNGLKPTATPVKPVPKGGVPTSAQKPADESSSGSDSDSDDSASDTDQNTKSAAKKENGKSSGDSTSSSGSSSESEQNTKNKALKAEPSSSESSEESDSSSDDERVPKSSAQTAVKGTVQKSASAAQESSSEESDSDSGDKMVVDKNSGDNIAAESTSQLSGTPWLNSSDFMLRKASSANPGKEVADFFSNANLEGKQVWYFTAPASLPITVLKDMEIDLSKATKGEALLTHKGDNYGLDLESYATNTQIQLLIPSRGGDKYTTLNHGIDSTVHLRRMAKFGPGGEVHATATDDYVPVPKPIRQQPEGLRVRYTPIGVPTPPVSSIPAVKKTPTKASSAQVKQKPAVESSSSGSESDSESDVEMTTPSASIAPASQTKAAKSALTNGDRKRRHSGNDNQSAKRVKAEPTPEKASMKKQAVVQAPNASATPSKKSSGKGKEKKEKVKQEKTPKPAVMTPTPAKQTPVPLPKIPGLKR